MAGSSGAATTRELPMFPLGTVLFPFAPLPLHVFEPRYRVLVHDCLAGEPEFGVVLIERGSEVGGGDTRFGVGTLARIAEVAELPDGRSLLLAVGVHRVRVEEWLPDDPYPRAIVATLDDHATTSVPDGLVDEVQRSVVRVGALRAELGMPPPPGDGPPSGASSSATRAATGAQADTARASFELAARARLSPLDAQRVLELDGARARLDALHALLRDEASVLEHQLRGG